MDEEEKLRYTEYTIEVTTLIGLEILKVNKIYKTRGREIRNKIYNPI